MDPMVEEAEAARALGTLFWVTGVMACFVIWKAVLYRIDLLGGSSIQTRRYFGGCHSCLVTLTVLDSGRVIYRT
jgi:hypothetical protein